MKADLRPRLPIWVQNPSPRDASIHQVKKILRTLKLHTVCESARCPNLSECFSSKKATFLILGPKCSRTCAFCSVWVKNSKSLISNPNFTRPKSPVTDPEEPEKIAQVAKALNLKHIVITSVTRDDLADGGASVFAECIHAIKKNLLDSTVEVLTSDFKGSLDAVDKILEAKPEVFNHNLETVPELYAQIRPQANYENSLTLLKYSANKNNKYCITKTGIMVGLGETITQIMNLLKDIAQTKCDLLTVGQYLQPTRYNVPVAKYYAPEEFEQIREMGLTFGIPMVFSAPLVRSSYQAYEIFKQVN